MKWRIARWVPYSIPLKQGCGMSEREGVFVHIETKGGQRARGEVAPLPGWSREGLSDVIRELKNIAEKGWCEEVPKTLPSVCCGIETALFQLGWWKEKKKVRETPEEASLVFLDDPCVKEQLRLWKEGGGSSVKVKLGKRPWEEELGRFSELVGKTKDWGLRFRLDLNRVWSAEEAEAFLRRLDGEAVEFVEEPSFPLPRETHGIPLALDETLYRGEQGKEHAGVKVWVLKPMFLGGVSRVFELAEEAENRGVSVVLSSAYETPFTLRFWAELSLYLPNALASGLGTGSFFSRTSVKTSVVV